MGASNVETATSSNDGARMIESCIVGTRQLLVASQGSKPREVTAWAEPRRLWRGRTEALGNILRAFPVTEVGPFQALCVLLTRQSRRDQFLHFTILKDNHNLNFRSASLLRLQSACPKIDIPPTETRSFTPGPAISNFLHPFDSHKAAKIFSTAKSSSDFDTCTPSTFSR